MTSIPGGAENEQFKNQARTIRRRGGGEVSIQLNLEQIQELIKRDYRVPRFVPVSLETTDTPELYAPAHISLRDLLLPVLKRLEIADRQKQYLLQVVLYHVGHGCTYPYLDNVEKQKYMNELAVAFPDVRWPVHYPPDVPKPTKETP